ncbi:MAG: hypothetical protein BKP49_10445 [Treponema sp. CETP13]|nr:MAG: hypothetical protein BKP49_10445 [Treponema sp. CETP13]
MNTIAIWYEEEADSDDSAKKELDINVNFWKLKLKDNSKESEYLMDFGFMIHDITNIKKLNIHFPFEVHKEDISDLGEALQSSKECVNSVFNENYSLFDSSDEAKQKSVQDQEHKTLFNIYALDFDTKSNDIAISSPYKGTQLSINLSNIVVTGDCKKYYFRIRIKGSCLDNFIKKFKPEHWYFQSAFVTTDTVDFRINEKRNLKPSLAQEISKHKTFAIKKIHFLLMRDAPDDLVADHLNITCRELEPELWSTYVGKKYKVENVIAYHWSEKTGKDECLESFNTLVKIKYNKSNKRTIWMYVLIVVGLAIGANIIYDILKLIILKIL